MPRAPTDRCGAGVPGAADAPGYVRKVFEQCSKAQCGAPATARVAFDALGCMVWIDRFDADGPRDVSARGAGALCSRHADRLVAPRGWAVQDRRGPDLRLWSERPPAPCLNGVPVSATVDPPPGARTVAPQARTRVIVRELSLPFDAPAPSGAPPRAASNEDADEIDRLLATPTSPLLSRAFNAAHSRQAG